jgi:hypothetical protein
LGSHASLYAAWEDYRNGPTDIYARAITGLMTATRDSRGRPLPAIPPDLLGMRVYPVPASDPLTLSVNLLVAGDVELELYDQLGRPVRRASLESTGMGPVMDRWSLRGLAAGSYFLRAHGLGGVIDVRKIMLMGTE